VSSSVRNVCGNCANFKPRQGDKFFNCTFAKQAGVPYAMQVRADTRSCEAFSAFQQPPKPQAPAKAPAKPPLAPRAAPPPLRLCSWGRLILVAILVIVILLIAWGLYTWVSHRSSTPTPTPMPTAQEPTPAAITPTPSPTPTPIPTAQVYNLGTWARLPPWLILASSATEGTSFPEAPLLIAPANTLWVEVTVTVQNIGTFPLTISAPAFTLWDSYGTKYPAYQSPTSVGSWFPYYQVPIGQGQLASGTILYQVPTIASGLRIVCQVGGQYLEWTLGF